MVAEERPLILANHHRIKPAIRICQRIQQDAGLRPLGPLDPPREPTIEELDHDHTHTGDQLVRNVALPGSRRRMVLIVTCGHSTVEGKSHTTDGTDRSAPRSSHPTLMMINPSRQKI